MLIDCDTCAAPASACSGCVMTVLLRGRAGSPPGRVPSAPGRGGAPATTVTTVTTAVELDDAERDAIGVLAHAGLVPPLRLVRAVTAAGYDGEAGGAPFQGAQGIA